MAGMCAAVLTLVAADDDGSTVDQIAPVPLNVLINEYIEATQRRRLQAEEDRYQDYKDYNDEMDRQEAEKRREEAGRRHYLRYMLSHRLPTPPDSLQDESPEKSVVSGPTSLLPPLPTGIRSTVATNNVATEIVDQVKPPANVGRMVQPVKQDVQHVGQAGQPIAAVAEHVEAATETLVRAGTRKRARKYDVNPMPDTLSDVNKKRRVERPAKKVYCVCQKPAGGHDMIQCDTCNEWFHDGCVGVNIDDYNGDTPYSCPRCR